MSLKYAFVGPNNSYAAIDHYTFMNINDSLIENGIPFEVIRTGDIMAIRIVKREVA